MKKHRNLTIGAATATLGLIFGVAVGARLSRSQPVTPAQVTLASVEPGDTPARRHTSLGKPTPPASARNAPQVTLPVAETNLAPQEGPEPEPDDQHDRNPTDGASVDKSPRLARAPGGPRVIHVPQEIEPVPVAARSKNKARKRAAQPQPAQPVVCVDPGHPSETSAGAHAGGLSENRLNWQVALRLRAILEYWGFRCVLTKQSENQYVTNRQRAAIANHAGALVFVRLHCDVGSGRGFAWYYPDRVGSKYGVSGPPPNIQAASRDAAFIINEAMKPVLKGHLRSNPIKTDASTFVGGKQGGVLTGSIFARVPTALIEMCFINQKPDALFIGSAQGQDKMAEALARGIYAWVYRR